MNFNRRAFLKKTLLSAPALAGLSSTSGPKKKDHTENNLLPISTGEILREDLFSDPVIIHSIELLRYEDNFLCRVRSKDGAEGISVSNNMQMVSLYPIFTRRIQPFFIGKDARKLETLLEEIYVYQSNYKLQNLAFWVPLATLEFAILDMLGKIASLPLANLLGETYHKSIAVYQANNLSG